MSELALFSLALVSLALIVFACQQSRRLRQCERLLEERWAASEQQIRELSRRVDVYLGGSIRMGEELHELRGLVAPLPDKVAQMEQRDPTALSFTQAARLAGMGASVDELTQACGLTKAEAELVSRMQAARTD